MLREAADAGAEFVRCAEFVGAVVGYDYRDGPEGVGYYRVGDPAAESRLLLREAAAAGADFVRCPEDVGKVPGYLFATGVDGEVGYYRQPDAPPPDPYEYMSLVLQRASAAGAAFVACPNYVRELPGYRCRPPVHSMCRRAPPTWLAAALCAGTPTDRRGAATICSRSPSRRMPRATTTSSKRRCRRWAQYRMRRRRRRSGVGSSAKTGFGFSPT